MKSRVAQYMNEIVSLTIMLLMTVALIAGQTIAADAAKEQAQRVEYSIVLTTSDD